jgi:hypothetical protein
LHQAIVQEVIGEWGSDDSAIIAALNERRKMMVDEVKNQHEEELAMAQHRLAMEMSSFEARMAATTEKLDKLQQEYNRLEILHSVDKQALLDNQGTLSSEVHQKTNEIAKLESGSKNLEKQLASLMNNVKNYHETITELRQHNKELATEIAEFQVCLLLLLFLFSTLFYSFYSLLFVIHSTVCLTSLGGAICESTCDCPVWRDGASEVAAKGTRSVCRN